MNSPLPVVQRPPRVGYIALDPRPPGPRHPELKGQDNSGVIQMTLEDFRRQFDTVYIGSAATPTR